MSETIDWGKLGRTAQAANDTKDAVHRAAEEVRDRAAAERKAQELMLLNRSWAVVVELKSACVEIATLYNVHVQDHGLRLSVLGGGVGKFSVSKGTRGVPRLEFSLEGVDRIEVNHVISERAASGSTEGYSVQPTGELLLLKGATVWTPKQVAEVSCKWLADSQPLDY